MKSGFKLMLPRPGRISSLLYCVEKERADASARLNVRLLGADLPSADCHCIGKACVCPGVSASVVS